MAGALRGITIEIGGDATKLGNELKETEGKASSLQRELRGVNTLLKQDPSNAHLIAQKYTLLGRAIEASRDKLTRLKAAQKDIDDGKVEATEEQYRDLQREIAQTEAKLSSLAREQAQFASTSAVQMQAIGKKWQDQGESIAAFGQKLMPLTVGIAALGAASSIAAIQFESSFAGVRKTVDATEEEFQQLEDAAREAAMTSPTDVNTINQIMELGGQLGIATENLSGFATVIGDLDVATNLNFEDAATNLAQFSNITGMAQEDSDRFGSTLVALGNTCATTESDIMNMAMRIAGAGVQVGMTQSDILGFSAALSSVGINAEAGGSAISTVISNIDKEVAMNGENLATWAEVAGMSVDQFVTAWQTDAAGAMQAVVRGMGDASRGGENLNIILDELGITNIRQTDMMKRMSSASDVMASSLNTASTAWEENTALTNEAAQRYATTESQILIMKNRIYDAGISIGQGLQPALLSLLEGITPVVEGIGDMAKAFEEADPATQRTVTTLALMAAGVAPTLIVTGKLTSGLGLMVGGLGKASAALAAKAAATTADTAATTANEAVTKRGVIATGLREIKDNLATVAAAKKATATTADTVATAANEAVTTRGAIATAAMTVATGAQTVATNVATVAQMAWNAAMAANPIGVVVLAVAGLAAGIGLLTAALDEAADDTQNETAATQELKTAMDDAQTAYDKAVEKHGEESDAALKAKAALDEATSAYNSNAQTIEQFCTTVDDAISSHDELMDSVEQTTSTAQSSAGAILNMSDELVRLAGAENKSAEDKARLQAVIGSLNSSIEGLNLSYDESTGKLNMTAEAVEALAKAEADRIRGEAAQENYNQLIEKEVELTDKQVQAKEELLAQGIEVEGMTRRQVEAQHENTIGRGNATIVTSDLTEAQKELLDSYYGASDALAENKDAQAEAIQTMTDTISKQSALEKAVRDVEAGTMTAAEAAEYYSEATGQKITADEVAEAQAAALAEAELQKATATSEATKALQEYVDEDARFGEILAASGYSVDEFATKLTDAGYTVDDLKEKIEEYSSSAQNGFEEIELKTDVTVGSMLETLQSNTEATTNWSSNITKLYAKAGSESETQFIQYIASLGPEYAPLVQELVNGTDGKLTELANAWQKGGDAAKIAALAEMGLLKEGMVTKTGELTEEAEKILEENAPELGAAGAEGGAMYTKELSDAIAKCPESVQTYIAQLEALLEQNGITIAGKGANAGQGYSKGLAGAIAQCPAEVQAYIAQLEGALADAGVDISALGGTAGTGYGSNMAAGVSGQKGNVQGSAAGLKGAAQTGAAGMQGNGTAAGSGFGQGMAAGIGGQTGNVQGSAGALKTGANKGTSGMGAMGRATGSGFGSSMAGGVRGQSGNVSGAAFTLANATKSAKNNNGSASSWGSELGSNFASGIRAAIGWVSSAATSLADAVRLVLGHSIPEEGPLNADGKGEALWGLHAGQNLAQGLDEAVPEVERSVNRMAAAAKKGMEFEVSPNVKAGDMKGLTRLGNGIRATFGVDIDQASLDAIRLQSAGTERRLDAVVKAVDGLAAKIKPDYQVVLDSGVLAGAMTTDIDKNLGTRQKRRSKGL